MRALIAAAFCLTLLSGCTAQSNPAETASDQEAEAAAAAPAIQHTSPSDVHIQKGYDLLTGLAQTTWNFDVAPEANGFARVQMIGRFVDDLRADGNYCLQWEWRSGDSYSRGSQGMCSQGGVVFTVNGLQTGHKTLLNWESLTPGSYSISVRADPQPHIMNVVIVVDNP